MTTLKSRRSGTDLRNHPLIKVEQHVLMSMATAAKIGSILVHAEEAASPGGHPFDMHTVNTLLGDPAVQELLSELRSMGILPVKRP